MPEWSPAIRSETQPMRNQPVHRAASVLLAGLLIPLATSGCALMNSKGPHFTADTMPEELAAPSYDNPRTVQWTNIAMPSVGSQTIAAGDVLEISVASGLTTESTVTWPVRVNARTGAATMPGIGSLPLTGLTLEGAEAAVTAACVNRGLFWSPNVTVTMRQKFKNRVMVLGGVKEPGVYDLPRDRSSLLAAVYAAGGLSSDAGSNIEIKSTAKSGDTGPGKTGIKTAGYSVATNTAHSEQVLRINLVQATQTGSAGYYIPDGATVMIEKRDPEPIHVMGLVKKPNRYDFPYDREVHVLDAIAMAGGLSSTVADKVFIIRPMPEGNGETAVIEVSLNDAKRDASRNIRLGPQDLVSVEHTPATVLLEMVKIVRFGLGASLTPLF